MTLAATKTGSYSNWPFTVFTCVLFAGIIVAEKAPAFLSIAMAGQLLSIIAFTHPKQLWHNFYGNKAFFYFSFCYLFLLLSFFYSDNTGYLGERLQIKLPLLLYALIIPSIGELSTLQKKSIFYTLAACVTLSATGILINYALHFDAINQLYLQSQIMPGPINHIRFSLLVVFTIYFTYTRILCTGYSRKEKTALYAVALFLMLFLHIYSVRSGLVCLYLMLAAALANYVIRTRNYTAFLVSVLVIATIACFSIFLSPTLKNKVLNTKADVTVYQNNQDPNYNSLSTRMVSYETALIIFRENILFGCGQGDLKDRNDALFRENHPTIITPIIPHNQFLYYLAATGLIGMLIFTVSFTAPFWVKRNYTLEFIQITFLVLIVAFQFEAMIETQLGVACTMAMILVGYYFSGAHRNNPTASLHK